MTSITGHIEIDKVLKRLPAQINEKLLTSAHRSALLPVVKKAKLLAPEGPSGNTVDSIGTEKVRSNRMGSVQAGPRRRGRNKGHVGHLSEFGTTRRFRKTIKGKRLRRPASTGVMKTKPFMGPAWDATKNTVNEIIPEKIGGALLRFMMRTLKK